MKSISNEPSPKAFELRSLIHKFIDERRQEKLDALKNSSPTERVVKAATIEKNHVPSKWLKDAAKLAMQLKMVTHSVKPMHSGIEGASSIDTNHKQLAPHEYVGTHCVKQPTLDVVGNAAALGVFKLLKMTVSGESILQLAIRKDIDFLNALAQDSPDSADIVAAFASLIEPPKKLTTHTLAKQIYWPLSSDVHSDLQFNLLSPLYPTALMQLLFNQIDDDLFGDESKNAREARKKNELSSGEIHDYPNLAFVKLGGSQPQNISQLNSERKGRSYMLASIPPTWKSKAYRPILHQKNMFPTLYREPGAAKLLHDFRSFIASKPRPLIATRERVKVYVEGIVEIFMNFTGQMRNLEGGWSLNDSCLLNLTEKMWLDEVAIVEHLRTNGELIPQSVSADVCTAFSLWVNDRIKSKTIPMGDDESLEWARYLRRAIGIELSECLDFDSEEQIK
jgi:CRISPR-associated protein Csy1